MPNNSEKTVTRKVVFHDLFMNKHNLTQEDLRFNLRDSRGAAAEKKFAFQNMFKRL
ncbi:hypothetical protein [Terribacillus saccharophilus]|uniref:hypothetical protein n=1 Tax=Terribacillus saccharophilus TaxID=361277 RepID=UPI003D2ACE28